MSNGDFWFNFPPIKGLDEFTDEEQLAHINTEIIELLEAWEDNDRYHMALEAMDVIHAVETFLRMKGITGEVADYYRDECERKNRIRGYYDDQDKTEVARKKCEERLSTMNPDDIEKGLELLWKNTTRERPIKDDEQ